MENRTFDQLEAEVRGKLRIAGLDEPELSRLTSSTALVILETYVTIPEAQRRVDSDLLRRDVAYAIPDEELDWIPSLTRAVLEAFVEGPFHAVPELVGILFRYRKLRIQIDADEAAVLRALKGLKVAGQPAVAAADIERRLASDKQMPKRPLSAVLTTLQEKSRGATILVREANGRWSIGDV